MAATQNAVLAIAAKVRAISGITQTFDYPPEQANYQPFAIVYISDGVLGNGPIGTRKDLWSISIDLLLPYTMLLDAAIELLTPFLDSIPAVLQGEVSDGGTLFTNTITTFNQTSISYIPNVDYAGVPMRGYRFTMEGVKILVQT